MTRNIESVSEPPSVSGSEESILRRGVSLLGEVYDVLERPIDWAVGWVQVIAEYWGS